jgi:hypothetical protein
MRSTMLLHHASRAFLIAALVLAAACSTDRFPTTPATGSANLANAAQQGPDLRAATAAKEKYAAALLRQSGIEGVAVTLTTGNQPAVVVFTADAGVRVAPRSLDSVPVVVTVTGPFSALLPHSQPFAKGKRGVDPTSRFSRPVPIGVSIGNIGECSAGTLGARVKTGANLYVLSNNHVLALENTAPIGSDILQPGRYDTNCSTSTDDVIATLSKFQPISFTHDNTVDVAIAAVEPGAVDNQTWTGGYGTPNHVTVSAVIGQAVQKCGRTTGCNTGTVSAIDATIRIQYSSGIATFVDQIVVSGVRSIFSRAGDSGSLIVTNDAAANPVALLFAGSANLTIANPIAPALQAMGVSIDGK